MLDKWKIQLEDFLRYNSLVRDVISVMLLLRVFTERRTTTANIASIERLCEAARLSSIHPLRRAAERAITQYLAKVTNKESLRSWLPQENLAILSKTIILKPRISDREKGVLFLSFSNQWAKLALLPTLPELLAEYVLVVAPSWSPPHSVANYIAPELIPGKIFTLISNERDVDAFRRMSKSYYPISLYASNWVDPSLFHPEASRRKDIDIIMVANFGKFKRHHTLFRALRDLPRSLRVVLVGQDESGRTANDLRAEARAFGVEDRFELIEDAPYERVCELLAAAKISLVLSLREGSCVVVTESILANTPVGIFADAELGSCVFIDKETGKFLHPKNLAEQLSRFLEEAPTYQPRAWALRHGIGCLESSKTLNDVLKGYSLEHGADWTCDLAPLRWNPDPDYLQPMDRERMVDAYRAMRDRLGVDVPRFAS